MSNSTSIFKTYTLYIVIIILIIITIIKFIYMFFYNDKVSKEIKRHEDILKDIREKTIVKSDIIDEINILAEENRIILKAKNISSISNVYNTIIIGDYKVPVLKINYPDNRILSIETNSHIVYKSGLNNNYLFLYNGQVIFILPDEQDKFHMVYIFDPEFFVKIVSTNIVFSMFNFNDYMLNLNDVIYDIYLHKIDNELIYNHYGGIIWTQYDLSDNMINPETYKDVSEIFFTRDNDDIIYIIESKLLINYYISVDINQSEYVPNNDTLNKPYLGFESDKFIKFKYDVVSSRLYPQNTDKFDGYELFKAGTRIKYNYNTTTGYIDYQIVPNNDTLLWPYPLLPINELIPPLEGYVPIENGYFNFIRL